MDPRDGRPTGPAAPRSPLHRAIRVVTAVEMSLAGAALLLVFGLVLVQAGQRYLPIDGWTLDRRLARYSLVWVTFVAAGVLVTRDGHIALQIVDSIRSEIAGPPRSTSSPSWSSRPPASGWPGRAGA